MKALAYTHAHSLDAFAIQPTELPDPVAEGRDLLVEIMAVGLNPVDYKIRSSRSTGAPVILGWDASGIVRARGRDAHRFTVGDAVFYSGDLKRPGSYATLQLVDERLVSLKPTTLPHVEAAALPLTSLTAYEMLFEKMRIQPTDQRTILVIGGAGGVGSQAIQLLKIKTGMTVIATASRPESRAWVTGLGADHIVSHRQFASEIRALGLRHVDLIFSTTHTDQHLPQIIDLIAPFGELGLIDDPDTFDISDLKAKSISVHWELMFTKSLFDYRTDSQGAILAEIAQLIDGGRMKTTANHVLNGLTAANIQTGHTLLEHHTSVGKIVIQRT